MAITIVNKTNPLPNTSSSMIRSSSIIAGVLGAFIVIALIFVVYRNRTKIQNSYKLVSRSFASTV
jgi:hypothetical protein